MGLSAHIHGGETSLGAIDNIYEPDFVSFKISFTSTEFYKDRVVELIESDKNVINVGALSITDIKKFKPINKIFLKNIK